MSKHPIFLLSFLLAILGLQHLQAQGTETKEQLLDTVRIYNCNYSIRQHDDTIEYKINGKPIDEKEFKRITNLFLEKKKCTPCVLIEMDLSGKKMAQGVFYQDCPGGDKKIELRDKTENAEQVYIKSNSCKDGEWIYYTEDGTLKEVKFYYHGIELKDKSNTLH